MHVAKACKLQSQMVSLQVQRHDLSYAPRVVYGHGSTPCKMLSGDAKRHLGNCAQIVNKYAQS